MVFFFLNIFHSQYYLVCRVILHDENYTSFAGSILVHKTVKGKAGASFKFWPLGGAPIRRGGLFEGRWGEGGTLIRGLTVPRFPKNNKTAVRRYVGNQLGAGETGSGYRSVERSGLREVWPLILNLSLLGLHNEH